MKHPTESQNPVVDLIYHENDHTPTCHKYVFWKQPTITAEALEDWILDYYERISDGYLPEGFAVAPRPHCARIYQRGNLLAEWHKPEFPTATELSPDPSAESPVTAKKRSGRGGIPAVVPSTTASGVWAIRRSSTRTLSSGNHDLSAVNNAAVAANFGAGQVSREP